jgi:hypothetical protein
MFKDLLSVIFIYGGFTAATQAVTVRREPLRRRGLSSSNIDPRSLGDACRCLRRSPRREFVLPSPMHEFEMFSVIDQREVSSNDSYQ